jgi:hypothetical protein
MGLDPFGQYDMIVRPGDARWGFIDQAGRMVIAPAYEDARPFDESGLAGVKQNGRWGFIDAQGRWVIQPQFDAIECRGQRPQRPERD